MNEQAKDTMQMFFQLITVVGVCVGTYLTWLNLRRTEYIHKRDEAHNAVVTKRCLASFNVPISFCEPILIELENCSKYPVLIDLDVRTNGFAIHYDSGDVHPNIAYNSLNPGVKTVVKPDCCFVQTIRLHTLKGHPPNASVSVYINNVLLLQRVYTYDKFGKCYHLSARA